jgi:hypothetical protein
VDTRGADVPDSFALDLFTTYRSPEDAIRAEQEGTSGERTSRGDSR